MNKIIYYPPAKKYLKKIKEKGLKEKYYYAIKEIEADYTVGTMKTGDLLGIYGYDIYYNSINYEIAYKVEELEDGTTVIIIMAGTRENFYNELKRYLK